MIRCIITGVPAGLGEPVFDKLDARLAHAMFSIGAVKGFEIGDGFLAAEAFGSENNDSFLAAPGEKNSEGTLNYNGKAVTKATNHAGGILGGISDGSPITMRIAVKPTPSIAQPQKTVDKDGNERVIEIKGRHDPIIVPRAVVVVEAMAALTVADLLLQNCTASLDHLEAIYKN